MAKSDKLPAAILGPGKPSIPVSQDYYEGGKKRRESNQGAAPAKTKDNSGSIYTEGAKRRQTNGSARKGTAAKATSAGVLSLPKDTVEESGKHYEAAIRGQFGKLSIGELDQLIRRNKNSMTGQSQPVRERYTSQNAVLRKMRNEKAQAEDTRYVNALRKEFAGFSPAQLRQRSSLYEQQAQKAERRDIGSGYLKKSSALLKLADALEKEKGQEYEDALRKQYGSFSTQQLQERIDKNKNAAKGASDIVKKQLQAQRSVFQKLISEKLQAEKDLSNREKSRSEGYKLDLLSAVTKNTDFSEKSNFNAGVAAQGGAHDADYYYRIVNNAKLDSGMRSHLAAEGTEDEKFTLLTDDEKKIFNYYYNTGNKKDAMSYLDVLSSQLSSRQYSADVKLWTENADAHPVLASTATILEAPARGVAGVVAAIGDAIDVARGKEIDISSPSHLLGNRSRVTREAVSADMGYWGRFLYNIGMSIGDNVANTIAFAPLSAVAGKAAGLSTKAVQALTSTLVSSSLASAGASDTIVTGKLRGLSDGQSLALGFATGLTEFLTEKMALEEILKAPKSAVLNFIRSGAIEGVEELTSGTVGMIADCIIAKDDAEIITLKNEYVKKGYSEAESLTRAIASSLGEQVLAGFISGGAMSGVFDTFGLSGSGTAQKNSGKKKSRPKAPEKVTFDDIVQNGKGEDVQFLINDDSHKVLKNQPESDTIKRADGSQYRTMWTIEEGVLSKSEVAQFYSKLSEKENNNLKNYVVSQDGDAIFEVGNKLIYTDSRYSRPTIYKVIAFGSENESVNALVREEIYDAEKSENGLQDAKSIIEITYGEGYITETTFDNSRAYARQNGRGKGTYSSASNSGSGENVISENGSEGTNNVGKLKNAQSVSGSKARSKNATNGSDAFNNSISQNRQKNNNNFEKIIAMGEDKNDASFSIYDNESEAAASTAFAPEDHARVEKVADDAKNLIGKLGFTVTNVPHVQNMPDNVDGYVDFGRREVYINPNAKNAKDVVLKHEITHILERSKGSRYIQDVQSYIQKNMREQWDARYAKNKAKYAEIKAKDPSFTITDSLLESETLADFAMFFSTDNAIAYYANNKPDFANRMKLFFRYLGLQMKRITGTLNSQNEAELIALKWERALEKAVRSENGSFGDGVRFSIGEIKGKQGSYGIGVILDADIFGDADNAERKRIAKDYVVNHLAGESFVAYDANRNPVKIDLAGKNEKMTTLNGKKKPVIKELAHKNIHKDIKQESVVLANELIESSRYDGARPAEHSHDWVDNYGKNDWEYRTVFLQQKDGSVWEATLNIANAADGRKLLYDIDPIIKKEEGPINSGPTSSNDSVAKKTLTVNSSYMQENEKDAGNDVSFLVSRPSGESNPAAGSQRSEISKAAEEYVSPYRRAKSAAEVMDELGIVDELLSGELDADVRAELEIKKKKLERSLSEKRRSLATELRGVDERMVARSEKNETAVPPFKQEQAVKDYRETGDTSGIPSRRAANASKKYYAEQAEELLRELGSVEGRLLAEDYGSEMERAELETRRNSLKTEHREAVRKSAVMDEVLHILDDIDTGARPNHTWVNDISPDLADKKNVVKDGTYGMNDFERNVKHFFGKYFALAKEKVLDPLFRSKEDYADYIRYYSDRIYNEVVKGLGIKKGSKLSAAVQWLGEGERPMDGKRKSDSETFEAYTYEKCVQEFGKEDAARIKQAADIFRACYDEMLDGVNATRQMLYPNNPDKLIPKRKDYFRHFQEMNNTVSGLLETMRNHLGIDPTLVGVSETTKPKSKWQSAHQQRTGKRTVYDAVGGFLDYLPQAAYATHIDPNIVNIRSLAFDLASAKAKEGASGNPNANSFIRYLQKYADKLAGKTVSHLDRAIADSTIGRPLVAALSWMNNRAKGNAVLGNFSSMLAQFGNIVNAVGTIKHSKDLANGALDAMRGLFGDKDIQAQYEKSGFLKERFLGKKLDRFEKYGPSRLAADALGIADEVGTRITWCAAYREGMRLGKDNPAAYADSVARACVAGRGIGEIPLNFESTVAKLFLPFRIEVNNNINVYRDILFGEDYEGEIKENGSTDFDRIVHKNSKKGAGKISAAKRTEQLLKLFVASSIINALFGALKSDEFNPLEDLFGADDEDEEWDVLERLRDLGKDYADGYGDGVLFDPIGQTVSGIYQGVTENDDAGALEKIGRASLRTAQNVAGDYLSNDPLAATAIGAVGVDSDAINKIFNNQLYVSPGTGMPAASSLAKSVGYLADGKFASAGAEALKIFALPFGGSQVDKTVRGLYEYDKGSATTVRPYERMVGKDDGSLKYLIEPNAENAIKSALFGPSAFSGASDDYYNADKKLTKEESAEILGLTGYEARKTKFDELLAAKEYRDKDAVAKRQDDAAEEYRDTVGEDSVIYQMYQGGFKNASPFRNVSLDVKMTIDEKPFSFTISAKDAEAASNTLSAAIAERFREVERSEKFRAMEQEEKEKYLDSISELELKKVKADVLHGRGAMPKDVYTEFVFSYERSRANQDRKMFVDDTQAFVESQAATMAQQYIQYVGDKRVTDETVRQVQKYTEYVAHREPSSVDKELLRLSNVLQAGNADLSDLNASGNPSGVLTYTKKGVEYYIDVPDTMTYEIMATVDDSCRSALADLFATNGYQKASDLGKKNMISSIKSKVRARIKEQLKANFPSIAEDKFQRILDMGGR